jgi:hypothetical protein
MKTSALRGNEQFSRIQARNPKPTRAFVPFSHCLRFLAWVPFTIQVQQSRREKGVHGFMRGYRTLHSSIPSSQTPTLIPNMLSLSAAEYA